MLQQQSIVVRFFSLRSKNETAIYGANGFEEWNSVFFLLLLICECVCVSIWPRNPNYTLTKLLNTNTAYPQPEYVACFPNTHLYHPEYHNNNNNSNDISSIQPASISHSETAFICLLDTQKYSLQRIRGIIISTQARLILKIQFSGDFSCNVLWLCGQRSTSTNIHAIHTHTHYANRNYSSWFHGGWACVFTQQHENNWGTKKKL